MDERHAATAADRPPPGSPGGQALHGDPRLKLVDATMKRHQHRPEALIEVLHRAQESFGFLSPELLLHIARGLRLPPSRVYGVATFYHFFSLAPKGEHTCVVCFGTACFVKGAARIVQAVERASGVRVGETTADGRVSIESARCLGACGIGPTVVYDGVVLGHQAPEQAAALVKGWLENGSH